MADGVNVNPVDIEPYGLELPEFPDAVISLGESLDVAEAEVIRNVSSARGRDIREAFCPVQALGHAFGRTA